MRPRSYPSHWHLSLSVIVSYIDVVLVPFPELAWHRKQFLKATGAACVRQPSPQAKQPTTASEAPRHVKKICSTLRRPLLLPLSSRQILVTIMHFSHGGAKSGSDLQEDGRGECRPGSTVKGFYFSVAPFILSWLGLWGGQRLIYRTPLMAPHTYHADKVAPESLRDLRECHLGLCQSACEFLFLLIWQSKTPL